MHKATIAEGVILLTSGAAAAGLADKVHSYGVPTAAVIAVIVFTLSSGLGFANQIGQALRTSYFSCPTKGCAVSIRVRSTGKAELAALRTLATDHSKHGSTR
ncbi:hypothetical protein AB0M00_43465 [Streptomyces chartreusis]|uniref:hypothetical protein n=1 Tax=Streptomyces chartreusis TaxID=1969 RepID=UPI0034191289